MKPKKLNKVIEDLRNNLNNLFNLGFYSLDEYRNHLDKLENMELYLMFETDKK